MKENKIKIIIDGEEKEIDLNNKEECAANNINYVDYIDDDSDDDYSIKGKIIAVTPLIATVVFLLLGFLGDLWHPGWIVFVAIPIVPLVLKGFGRNTKGTIMNITNVVVLITFFILGFAFDLWHPGWLVFFLIPIVAIIIGKEE